MAGKTTDAHPVSLRLPAGSGRHRDGGNGLEVEHAESAFENQPIRGDGAHRGGALEKTLEEESRTREALLFMLEDLDENRRTIEQAHREWVASVDVVRDPIMVHDGDFRVLRANRAYAQRAGLDFQDIIGRPYWEFFPKGAGPLAGCRRRTDAMGRDGHDEAAGEEITLDSGETFVSRAFAARDETGRFLYALHIFEDITERKRVEEALRESEEHFRAVFEQAGVGMALREIAPRNPRWLRVNQKLCDILGYTQGELLKLTSTDIAPPEDRDLAIEYGEKLRRGEIASYSRERRYVRKDGRIIWARISVTAVSGPDGRRTHALSVIEDITGRKEAEEKIRRLSRVRAVLGGINAAIVRISERQALLDNVCRIAVEQGGFGMAWVSEFDPVSLDATPVAWAGEGVAEHVRWKSTARTDTPMGQGAVGRAVRAKKTIVCNDLAAEADVGSPRRRLAVSKGYRSLAGLPLIVEGGVAGVVTLYAKEPGFFDEDEIGLLNELAGNISFALEHMARQLKIEKLSRIRAVSSAINATIVRSRDRPRLFSEACRIAVEHGKFGIAWIGVLDLARQEVVPVASAGLEDSDFLMRTILSVRADAPHGQGVLPRAVRERRPVYNNDITVDPAVGGQRRKEAIRRGYRSVIVLPLIVEGGVVGTFSMFAKELNYFDSEEVKLLTELVGNISFALEHMARQEKIEKLARIRAVLGAINAAIVRIHNKQELFDEACRIAVEAGKFPFAWLGLVDRQAKQVRPVAWAGAEGGFLSAMQDRRNLDDKTPQGPKVSARAVLEKKAVVVNDVQNDPRVFLKQEHRERNINSIAVLPLLVADEAVGVLSLHAREAGFFDEEEMRLLHELAGDISFALQTIEKQENLDYLSYYDVLTGLPNRKLFLEHFSHALHAAGQSSSQLALALGDIRRFRMINDTLGRHAGDEVLKQVSGRLARLIRNPENLARIATDCFATFLPDVKDLSEVAHRIENLAGEALRNPIAVAGQELNLAFTVGISVYPHDGTDAETLLRNAEAALKKAKAAGERYLFYQPQMNARVTETLLLENKMRRALEKEQFVLHYQPKIDLAKGVMSGLEALIRWNDPETGLVPPAKFIPLLEETGLILDVGRWAILKALSDYREWCKQGLQPPRIAVNVSPIQLRQKDFVDIVREAVSAYGAESHGLDLEITESLIMEDIEGNIGKLRAIKDMGVNIAIDDFGTGYSSLGYLAKLPVSALKIDRSFVISMAKEPDSMAIVSTIISLAHSLNLRVVAEGVETQDQSKLLMLLKCDEAQGYLFSKPVPAAEIEFRLRTLTPVTGDRAQIAELKRG